MNGGRRRRWMQIRCNEGETVASITHVGDPSQVVLGAGGLTYFLIPFSFREQQEILSITKKERNIDTPTHTHIRIEDGIRKQSTRPQHFNKLQ